MPENPEKKSLLSFATKWKSSYERNKRLPSAYLFAGPVGSGKKQTAEEIAHVLLKPTGKLENHPDFIYVAPEKTSIKIEEIRQLIHRLSLKPFQAEHVLVLIEDANTMTLGAANALLKTLEEPPAFVLFILMTSMPDQMLPTIRSRCQNIAFQIQPEIFRENLQNSFLSWEKELAPLLQSTTPSFTRASKLAEEIATQADRLDSLFELLQVYWHDVATWQKTRDPKLLFLPQAQTLIEETSKRRAPEQIFVDIDMILETERAIDGNVNKTLALERLFSKLTA